MDDHAPPKHASIKSYHLPPVLIRSNDGSNPSSPPWNSHETTFYTASAFKAVHAIESGVRPSPFSLDHFRVFPRHRGSLGRDIHDQTPSRVVYNFSFDCPQNCLFAVFTPISVLDCLIQYLYFSLVFFVFQGVGRSPDVPANPRTCPPYIEEGVVTS